MNKQQYDYFIKLPDWKKFELKNKDRKFFKKYPVMTKEQEYKRWSILVNLCTYFSQINLDEQTVSFDLEEIWPEALSLFITPKLLEIFPMDLILEFGKCYFCKHYKGHNKIPYKELEKINVTFLYGICNIDNYDPSDPYGIYNDDSSYFAFSYEDRVIPLMNCCQFWTPNLFNETIIEHRIKKFLEENKNYDYDDYKLDLRRIKLWDFFSYNR